jgi:hypothetical protein
MQIAAKRLAEPGVKIAAVAEQAIYAHSVSWAGANARPEVCSKHSFVHPAVRDTSLTRRGLLPPDADEVRTECRSAPGD